MQGIFEVLDEIYSLQQLNNPTLSSSIRLKFRTTLSQRNLTQKGKLRLRSRGARPPHTNVSTESCPCLRLLRQAGAHALPDQRHA
jgi:hypothetical protein